MAPFTISWIILPQVWVTGLETENLQDLVTHPSIDVDVEYLQEKIVHIRAIEFITAGMPGALWCWIETSPVPFTTTDVYHAAIGGGGGPINPATLLPYINPVVPAIIVPTGAVGTIHTLSLPWAIHSPYARVVLWTPVAAIPLADFWMCQAMVTAKG